MRNTLGRLPTVSRRLVAVAGLTMTIPKLFQAQVPVTPPGSGAVLTTRDIALFAGATLGSAAVSRFDIPLARTFADSAMHMRHGGFTASANRASLATETALMITGTVVYVAARVRHDDDVQEISLHTTESVASAAMVIQVVRGALGRARPYVVDDAGQKRDADPYDFEFLHGFTSFNYRSYPSMHAMASMAVASALSQEMRFHDSPNRRIISPILYTAAILPSLGRMYLDEHWASDITMGMFLGLFAGQKVVMYSRDHPDNRVDRTFYKPSLRATVLRDGNGFSLNFSPF